MKKKRIFFLIPIITIVVIFAVLFITASIPDNNNKLYKSELSGREIIVPQNAFGFSELYDEETGTYTVKFYLWGFEDNVLKSFTLLEQKSINNNNGYALDQLASNDHGLFSDFYLTYTAP